MVEIPGWPWSRSAMAANWFGSFSCTRNDAGSASGDTLLIRSGWSLKSFRNFW